MIRTVLVDDVEDLRTAYRAALERGGLCEVVAEAGTGEEALSAIGRHSPELILLDLSLPDISGEKLIPKVRELTPGATVLVLTGFEDEDLQKAARDAGADDVLIKGIGISTLRERISTIMNGERRSDRSEPSA